MTTNRPTGTREALTQIIDTTRTMSAEMDKATRRNRSRIGAKYDAANDQHAAACRYLQANDRWAWMSITRDRHVSTAHAQELLDSDYARTPRGTDAFTLVGAA